jgi:hypothetical protein
MQLVGEMVLELGRGVGVQVTLHRDQGHILTGQADLDGQGIVGNGHVYLQQQRVLRRAVCTAEPRLPLNAHVMPRILMSRSTRGSAT